MRRLSMRKNILNLLMICATLLASFSPLFVSTAQAQSTPNPDSVNIPGTHQDELGCPGDWMPTCENTLLTYDLEDAIWQGSYEIQPANDNDAGCLRSWLQDPEGAGLYAFATRSLKAGTYIITLIPLQSL